MTRKMWAVKSQASADPIATFNREADAWLWALSPDREWGDGHAISSAVACGDIFIVAVEGT